MSDYRPIFTFRLEHDYYMHNVCRSIGFRVAPSGMSLLKRRGLVFKQIADNEWCIIGDCAGSGVDDGSDTLELEMVLLDPKFKDFTVWSDFNLAHAYNLQMPCESSVVDATQVIQRTNIKRRGDAFCSVQIKLSNQMFENARNGKSEDNRNTLRFYAPKVYWEYIFIPRSGEANKDLILEDVHNNVTFSAMKKVEVEPFPTPVLHTISESLIPMREHYDLSFSLMEIVRREPLMKRTLLRQLPHPSLGRFITERPDSIQQICYF